MSRVELATEFGVPELRVGNWENGHETVPSHVMRSLGTLASLVNTHPSTPPRHDVPIRSLAPEQHGFPWANIPMPTAAKAARTGTFADNMKLPVHRWFRYSAGFSAEWVRDLLADRCGRRTDELLFDPFAGSGTALIAARQAGYASAGAEQHSFVHRIAAAKLTVGCDVDKLRGAADRVLAAAKCKEGEQVEQADLLSRCYSPDALARLVALRTAYLCQAWNHTDEDLLIWLALTAVLRECSGVGTAQWQYILPAKTKVKVVDPYVAFSRRIDLMCADLVATRGHCAFPAARLERDDARSLAKFADLHGRVTLVVTSPPYPNNYDYADATRLEMTFWKEVASWSDLHRAVRHELVRSCSQHSAADRLNLDDLLDDDMIAPIVDELRQVTTELAVIRESKGGKKTYHTMVAAYFADLARVWHALRPLCADGADVCFVVGDSAPYGVHVPVEQWLAKLADAAGFGGARFEKVRDRNVKWKNRKHRVPLQEGRLWLKA